jgi:hypothetical protein
MKTLQEFSALSKLRQQLDEKARLLELVRKLLPEALAAHCSATVLRSQTLVIFTDSPVWVSRLHYMGRSLRQQLGQRGISVARIEARVALQSDGRQARTFEPARPLSRKNAQLLRDTAEFQQDRELKAALLRLSRHVTNRQG